MSAAAAVVLAPPIDSYPPLHVVPEACLEVRRVEPCACGGRLVQLEGDDVAAVVGRHNETIAHRAWRLER